MGKLASPNSGVWWVPAAGLTDPYNPSAAQINAGTRISPAMETGYTLGFTDSDTDNSKTVEDEGNVETPTLRNYEAKFSLFLDEVGNGTQDAPENATAFTAAFDLFKTPYVEGYLIHRIGRKGNVPVAAGHLVSVFKVKNDHHRVIEGDAVTPIKVEVEFLTQGLALPNVVCAA